MIKRFLTSITYLFFISLFTGFVHFYLVKNVILFNSIYTVYRFNFTLGFFELFFLHYVYEKYNDKVGYAFLAIGIIKMALSISFLMPLITSNLKDKIPDTLNFFFCYFVFLIIESVILVKLLSKKQ